MREVCNGCEVLQSKEATNSFENPSHKLSAIITHYVGSYTVRFDPFVEENGNDMRCAAFKVGFARVSLEYRLFMITTNWFLFVVFSNGQ